MGSSTLITCSSLADALTEDTATFLVGGAVSVVGGGRFSISFVLFTRAISTSSFVAGVARFVYPRNGKDVERFGGSRSGVPNVGQDVSFPDTVGGCVACVLGGISKRLLLGFVGASVAHWKFGGSLGHSRRSWIFPSALRGEKQHWFTEALLNTSTSGASIHPTATSRK